MFNNKEKRKLKINSIVESLGGLENIKEVDSCISRLRLNIIDVDKIDFERLKKLGSLGHYKSTNVVHLLFGNESDIIKNEIQELKNI